MRAAFEIELEITDLAFPNDFGVAREEGRVIFAPGGLPGDRVRAVIRREEKRYAYAELIQISRPSADRVRPECSHAGACGGCTLQHLSYQGQLAFKERHVAETLRRIAGFEGEVLPIVPSPEKYGYRSKIELAFGREKAGVVLGFRERVSPFRRYEARVVPVGECPVFGPAVARVAPVFADLARGFGMEPYDPRKSKGLLKELVLRQSMATGELMVLLDCWGKTLRQEPGIVSRVRRDLPEVTSLCAVFGDDVRPLLGEPRLRERLEFMFDIEPLSFFQPNPAAAAILYRSIAALPGFSPASRVLGLYCGIGPIELSLARHVGEVVGVDSLRANIAAARRNASINGIDNCRFEEGTVESLSKRLARETFDVMVVDPPRTGLSRDALRFLMETKPLKVVYVSCDPATLARDLKVLLSGGYEASVVRPFDFFPHASHVETLVMLER